jgi:hypothetical protein
LIADIRAEEYPQISQIAQMRAFEAAAIMRMLEQKPVLRCGELNRKGQSRFVSLKLSSNLWKMLKWAVFKICENRRNRRILSLLRVLKA